MYHLIVNPTAARGRTGARLSRLCRALDAAGISYEIHTSEYPDHAVELLARIGGTARTVVAVGGDGTVNQTVNAARAHDVLLGVLPTGTGNDFAHQLGVARLRDAIDTLKNGRERRFDVAEVSILESRGTVLTRRFINTMGVGFDAAVGARARNHGGSGILPYLAAVMHELRVWKAVDARITHDGVVRELPLFLATVGNGRRSGGGFLLTPAALPDDGLLDLCVARDMSRGRVLRVLPRTFNGSHLTAPEVETARATSFSIELDAPLALHLDGEIMSTDVVRIDVRVVPSAQRVLTR